MDDAQDIEAGAKRNAEIAAQLDESSIGLICLTRENQHMPWVQFELGAISKALGAGATTKVIPILIDFDTQSELSGPLSTYNNVMADEAGFLRVIETVHVEPEDTRTAEQINAARKPICGRARDLCIDRPD